MSMTVKQTVHLLLLARDAGLPGELESALAELPEEQQCVLHTEFELRRGIEFARNRQPDVVLIELDSNAAEARRAAAEITDISTAPLVVGLYRGQDLEEGNSAATLIELMRVHFRDFLRRPLSAPEIEGLLRRHLWNEPQQSESRGKVLSFVGNKGGVGKTTISLNTACALARKAPDRVLLVDASLQHGSSHELLDLSPSSNICDAARQVDRLDEHLLRTLSAPHSCGLRLLAAPPNAVDAAPVDDQVLARILAVGRRAFDYVVVDTFPIIDSVTIAVLDVSDLVFVVFDDFVPSVRGASDLLQILQQLGVSNERLRVVLNHSQGGFRGRLRDTDVSDRLGCQLDHVVPHSRRVLTSTNEGSPYVLRAPRRWGFGRAIDRLANSVLRSHSVTGSTNGFAADRESTS